MTTSTPPPGDDARPKDRDDREDPARHRSRRHRCHRHERKERVLHTRISEDLSEDLRRMADDLRVPVSNIVRAVLEEAFSVVEKVTDDVGDLIGEVVGEAEAARDRIRRSRRHRRHRHSGRRAFWEADEARTGEDPDEATPMPAATASAPAEVIGWQPLILAGSRSCGECGAPLEPGTQAYAAITQQGIGASVMCEGCLREKRRA